MPKKKDVYLRMDGILHALSEEKQSYCAGFMDAVGYYEAAATKRMDRLDSIISDEEVRAKVATLFNEAEDAVKDEITKKMARWYVDATKE